MQRIVIILSASLLSHIYLTADYSRDLNSVNIDFIFRKICDAKTHQKGGNEFIAEIPFVSERNILYRCAIVKHVSAHRRNRFRANSRRL